MQTIKIRKAIFSDAMAIAKVHVASWQAIYRGHISDRALDNLSVDEREKRWKEILDKTSNVFVLEDNKNIIGFVSFCPSRDQDADRSFVAEISSMYLHPAHWRKGLGRLLCHAAMDELRNAGYHEVTLWVLDGNKQAKQFYENMGFDATLESKIDTIGDCAKLKEIRYRKKLSNSKIAREALSWITSILIELKIPFLIAGGLAAITFGSTRELEDIDIDIPEEKFELLKEKVAQFIVFGPERFKDDKWDVLLMTLNYHNQLIDLGGSEQAKIYDKTTKKWINLLTNFSTTEIKNVFGLNVPVIARDELIAYKKILAREVDIFDIKEITRKPVFNIKFLEIKQWI